MNKRQGQQQNKYRQQQEQQSPKHFRQQQQQNKTNPKKLRRTSINEIEAIIEDVPIHDSFDGTTIVEITTTYYKRYDLLNLMILCSLVLVCLSFILIIITFIFPNWLTISLPIVKQGTDNVLVSTSILNNNALNTSIGRTQYDIGLWELKLNQSIKIVNSQSQLLALNTTQSVNQSRYSVLWLNDNDSIYNDYIRELLRLLDFTKSTIFIIEILEILHLIFTFIVIVLLFVILCLCKKNYFGRGIKLWHFVSYIMSIVTFFMGLGTLIQIALWQASKNTQIRIIEFSWCYWCLVAELAAMLLVVLLIQINLVFACVDCYKRKRKPQAKIKSANSLPANNNIIMPPVFVDSKPVSANSRSTVGLINRSSKTTPNISTIDVTQQQQQHTYSPEHLIKPSALLNNNNNSRRQSQVAQNNNEYLNDRMVIPRPAYTSSNTNIKSTSSSNSRGFDNLIYYNGQSTYRTNN